MTTLSRQTAPSRIISAVEQLFTSGVMSHSGHANLSAKIDEKTFLITTTGMVRNLSEKDFAVVDLAGKIIEGDLEPTNREIVEMHSIIYSHKPDVGAVIHTHSPHILAFALANKPLPCRYEALLRFGQAAEVPVAAWGPRGSKQSVEAISTTLAENVDTSAILLANHGLLAFAESPQSTAGLIAAIEEAAEAELRACDLGGATDFPQGALQMVRESMAKARQ